MDDVIAKRTMATTLIAADWIASPASLNTTKHGENAIFSRDDSVVERQRPYDYWGDCVCYTSHPLLPGGQVWQTTVLDTTSRWGEGLSVGVTATLPHWVPDVLPTTEAGSDEWYYDGNRLYHNRSSTEFPNIPPLHNVSTCQKVGLQISTNGQLHLFIDEQHMECIATGLPVNKPLWGAVNVFGDCTKIKSEMLSEFPDVKLVGVPHEIPVPSEEPVTISPAGLGVTLTVPPGAVPSDPDKLANVTLKACLPSPSFTYPEGVSPISAVYHLSADSNFEKKVEMTFEHFAEIVNEEQAHDVILFKAESSPIVTDGKREFTFSPVEGTGSDFAVGEGHCTVSTKQCGFMTAGTLQNSNIRKRYAVLCSYSNEIQSVGHAAVAVTLDDEVYIKNFREAVQQEWKTSLSHRCRLNIRFDEADAHVDYPMSLSGWNIVADTSHCMLSQEDVDISNPSILSAHDYPPRVFFEVMPTVCAKACTLQLSLSGLSKKVDFQISLRNMQPTTNKPEILNEKVVMEKPTLLTLMKLTTRIGAVIKVIENSANHYKLIGTILLDDRYGERVETIENDLRGKGEAIIREIYKKWMKEDTNCSWLTLTECFRDCNLHRLASDIEEHFGFPSPSPKVRAVEEVHPRALPSSTKDVHTVEEINPRLPPSSSKEAHPVEEVHPRLPTSSTEEVHTVKEVHLRWPPLSSEEEDSGVSHKLGNKDKETTPLLLSPTRPSSHGNKKCCGCCIVL